MYCEHLGGSHKAGVDTGTDATPSPASPSLAGVVEGLGGSPLCVSPTTQVLVSRSLCLAPFTLHYIQD